MSQQTIQRIESLLDENKVILFMKGTPQTPMCGFSSNTVKILKDLIPDDFNSFNVLEDQEIREGIKQYGQWPTIPQLYINKELVGGNDIITEMFNTGELQKLLDLPQPDRTAPEIKISEQALEHIKNGLTDIGDNVLYLNIDDAFNTRFSLETPKGYEIISQQQDIKFYMDIATAKRAQGIEIDWVDELQGSGLRIKNPNEPPAIKHLSIGELKKWIDSNKTQAQIFDVRPEEKFSLGSVPQSKRLSKQSMQDIGQMDKQTPLVFVCQIGKSSLGAADHFRKQGFDNVYSLTGGYNAWLAEQEK